MNVKKALKAMIKNKSVRWNDPDGVASGNYKIVEIDEGRKIAKITDKNTSIEVDVADLE